MPIPDWAANALKDIIYGAVQGDFVSWDEAFGKLFVDIQRRRARSLALMLKVWARIHQRNQAGEPKLEELFTSVGEEFDIGATSVKELYGKIRDAISDGEWVPDPTLIESIASKKAP